jgi:CheY-like chemotaxis protein
MPNALIIDDNPNNTTVLAEMLHLEGVTSIQVQHPEALEETLRHYGQVDVIFLDLEMPKQNGYDVMDMLQRDTQHQAVPIVAYTVHVSEINTARERGFHSFLAKPLDADAFPDQLARILRGERVWTRG